MLKFIIAYLLLLSFTSCTRVQNGKGDAAIEQKIEALLSRMTLEEKIGQMNQISSYGNIEDMSGLIKKGEVGSILNEVDPVRVNALQRVAMEESRLGIPLLMARDVIHGFKTIFPIPLGQAASFNPQVAEDGARVAAVEASAVGIRWTFAPMIDVARDPRWGRMAEGCGEDTYLTSVMGAAMVKGFQGDSLNNPTSIAACPKHFVGYGAAEGGRDYNSTFIPERRLRNVYLPPFEAAAKAGAATFMTSFNDNDGVPSTGNTFILKDVLRGEWGFDGVVVSDWASVAEMIAHGFAPDSKEAAMKAVNAGVENSAGTDKAQPTGLVYRSMDFGEFGSDEITLAIFANDNDPHRIQIWEGEPGENASGFGETGELVGEVTYQKPGIWEVFQPETFTLSRRLKGVINLTIVSENKFFLKEFHFTKQEKAYARLSALTDGVTYGDSFVRTADAIEQIGNNVSLEFADMDFGTDASDSIVICGRTPLQHNTIQLRFSNGETQVLSFPHSGEYREMRFPIQKVTGEQKVTFVFLPGCNFDFKWFRFEKSGSEE